MNTIIWFFQALLAAWFIMPVYKKLSSKGLPFPIRLLGILELFGLIGIILPELIHVLPILTPVTAVCFAVIMIGAFFVHFKKKEYKILPLIVLAFILSIIVAYFRFRL